MTLTLSAVIPDFAIQVSDRRITSLLTGEIMDSMTNKAVVFGNRMVFCYTGLAELEGQPTDRWLADALHELPNGMPMREVADHIANRAERAVSASKCPPPKRHLAFCGVGWLPNPKNGKLRGVVYTISNFHNYCNEPMDAPLVCFTAKSNEFNHSKSDWCSFGVPLTYAERYGLRRAFAAGRRRRLSEFQVSDLFAHYIRKVASRTPSVGRDLMLTIFPKRAAEHDAFVKTSFGLIPLHQTDRLGPNEPTRGVISCGYWPWKAPKDTEYCPCIVVPGVMVLSEFAFASGDRAVAELHRGFGLPAQTAPAAPTVKGTE